MLKKHIPNTITSLNLFSGSIAVYFGFQGNFTAVLLLVILAAIFDFFDGFAARALKAYSPLGKELDSLADMISFGLAPSSVAFSILRASSLPEWLSYAAFVIAVFSALRLAKFNIDERQTSSFIGMPTPANAIFWIGVGYSYSDLASANPWIVLILIVIFSGLLVAEIPMFSLKFKNLTWKNNYIQFIFLGVCCLLLILMQLNAFAPIILVYLVFAILKNLIK